MNAHRIETILAQDGKLTLNDLPFQAGDAVEVIITACSEKVDKHHHYSLRGKPVQYDDPFEPIAAEEWEAVR